MNKIRTLALLMTLCMVLSVWSAFGVSAETAQDDVYISRFFEHIDPDNMYNKDYEKYCELVYKHYSNPVSSDEATPDYVMADAGINPIQTITLSGYIGEYVLITSPNRPYIHGIYIYLPSEDKVYTLEEAYNAGVEGIEEAFKTREYTIALVGDCDANYELNVKDATCVQKRIADLDVPQLKFWEPDLVYNFNRDEVVNIKDATAIQKHIAGLEY